MIVNIQNIEKFLLIKNVFRFIKMFYLDLIQHRVKRQLIIDTEKLKSFFQTRYPKLATDSNSNILCVSCDLCQTVCPTQAIEVKKANMVNFPKSLTSGEAPMHFYLDLTKCIKCGECSDVCLVNAIEMTADYSTPKVDLALRESS